MIIDKLFKLIKCLSDACTCDTSKIISRYDIYPSFIIILEEDADTRNAKIQ